MSGEKCKFAINNCKIEILKKKKIEIKKFKNSNSNSERMKKSQLLIANITLSLDNCYYAII